MNQVTVDFAKPVGPMRPMHAVNNGPVYKFTEDQRITNLDAFREAAIPYARTHDASFCASYGGEHCVDILAVFPDFDADENDPASYDFTLTDEYLKVMTFAGVKPFYRLGSKIEHWPKKYGTLVPKDFAKWARVCEHIIRHYNEGWAGGFAMDIDYWEIWNEPDGAADDADPVDKKCWAGTCAQFCRFYDVAARHLKACFPERKIGGPAVTYPLNDWVPKFLAYVREHQSPLDFFSWHCYQADPAQLLAVESKTRALLDEYGFTRAESILNEWNYVKGWTGNEWVYSLRTEKNLKGAAFIASVIAASQYRPLDMLMFYDARPGAMNSLFSTDLVCDRLKGYYPFRMFNVLHTLGTAVAAEADEREYYACAAAGDGKKAVMVTRYRDVDTARPETLRLALKNLGSKGPVKLTYAFLDETHDQEVLREEIITGENAEVFIPMGMFTTCLVTVSEAGTI